MRKAIIEVLGAIFAAGPLSNDAEGRRSRQIVFAVVVLSFFAVMVTALSACAIGDFSSQPPELVVEGDESSYPAFETAARICGYTAFSRFPGATLQQNISVGPHFNLFRTRTRAARCAIDWVDEHPQSKLRASYH